MTSPRRNKSVFLLSLFAGFCFVLLATPALLAQVTNPLASSLGVYGDIPLNNSGDVTLFEDQDDPNLQAVKNVRVAVIGAGGPIELTSPSALAGFYVPYADAKGMFHGAEPHMSLDEKNEVLTWNGKVSAQSTYLDLLSFVRLSGGYCGGKDEDGNLKSCSIHPGGHADIRQGVYVAPDRIDPAQYPTNNPTYKFWCLHLSGGPYLIQVNPSGINQSPCSDLHNCQCPPDASGTKNCDGTNPACFCYKADNGSVQLVVAPVVEGYQSGQMLSVTVEDRTPPHIQPVTGGVATETDGGFPDLFKDPLGPKATTGDYCVTDEVQVWDNNGGKITTWFALNRQNGPGEPTNWGFDNATDTVKSGEKLSHVFIPDDMYGDMEYSIFSYDEKKNYNPGDSKIDEDQPHACYGIQGGPDLDPNSTHRFVDESELVTRLQGPGPVHTGEAFIDDNDLPNFFVKVISKRDKEDPAKQNNYAWVFPPATAPVITGGVDAKLDTLMEGVKLGFDDVYDPVNFATMPHFINILEVKSNNPGLPAGEQKLYDQFTDNSLWASRPPLEREKYLRGQFRLESYAESDTKPDGSSRDGEEASFGLRRGWGDSATVFFDEPIIEDVEHEIWLWADDNVKFMNYAGQHVPFPYHGIKELVIDFSDPRQKPPITLSKKIVDPPDFWTGPIPVVFREPTTGPGLNPPAPGPMTVAACKTHYPSLHVVAKDYKGNARELTVLFNVMDQKAAVRVLEQKQQKE